MASGRRPTNDNAKGGHSGNDETNGMDEGENDNQIKSKLGAKQKKGKKKASIKYMAESQNLKEYIKQRRKKREYQRRRSKMGAMTKVAVERHQVQPQELNN